MENIHQKTVIITGGAYGIGKGMAKVFAAQNANIVLADLCGDKLEETVSELQKFNQGQTIGIQMDVASVNDWDRVVQKTLEHFSSIDILCNNAGIGYGAGLAWEHNRADWDWNINVNLMGAVNGVQAVLPRMLSQQTEGHIINTSSLAGLQTGVGNAMYVATKHALVAYSECLFNDLQMIGAPVGVSVLCPGFVKSDIMNPLKAKPDHLEFEAPKSLPPQAQVFIDAMNHAVDTGMEPEQVGEIALEGILRNQFYLLTHSYTREFVEQRLNGILEAKAPIGSISPEVAEYLKQSSV